MFFINLIRFDLLDTVFQVFLDSLLTIFFIIAGT